MGDEPELAARIDGAVVAALWGERGSRLDVDRRRAVVEAVKRRLRGDEATPVDVALEETSTLRLALHSHVADISSRESVLDDRLAVDMALDVVVAEAISRRIADLEATALVDPLTGLGNRRAAERAFDAALAYRDRHGGVVAVALADLVGLKRVNDEHGHAAGDATLAGFADALRRSMRVADSAFRFGGDEFVVMAPGATAVELAKLFDRVRGDAPMFTVGIAEAPADGLTDVALLAAADARMYAQRRRPSIIAGPPLATPTHGRASGATRRRRVGALVLLLVLGVVGPLVALARHGDGRDPTAPLAVATSTTTTPAVGNITDPPRPAGRPRDGAVTVAEPSEPTPTTAVRTPPATAVPVAASRASLAPAAPVDAAPGTTVAPAPTTTTTTTTTTVVEDDDDFAAAQDDHDNRRRGGKPPGNRRGHHGRR